MSRRLPWERRNYPVFAGTHYKKDWEAAVGKTQPGIADRPEYQSAKFEADVDAALKVVKKSLSNAYIAQLQMMLNEMDAKGFKRPVLVAPFREDSKNVLARTTAAYLGDRLGLEVDTGIVQMPTAKGPFARSQKQKDTFERMLMPPSFGGTVIPGTPYIGVDDMFTTGGTLSELRSYIDKNGGRFISACALATKDGQNTRLNPLPQQINNVYDNLGSKLAKWITNHVGLEIPTLTGPEATFLSSRRGIEEIRFRHRLAPG